MPRTHYGQQMQASRPDDADDLTLEDLDRLFPWLPFDWRWLLLGWLFGFAAGGLLVLWFLIFIAGPTV